MCPAERQVLAPAEAFSARILSSCSFSDSCLTYPPSVLNLQMTLLLLILSWSFVLTMVNTHPIQYHIQRNVELHR